MKIDLSEEDSLVVSMRKGTPDYVKEIAKGLRKEQTESEKKLWQLLRGNRFKGYKFRRQYSFGRYIADFYCSKARLVIEIDGQIHEQLVRKEYDQLREKELLSRGVKILRFTNNQVMNEINKVLNEINKIL